MFTQSTETLENASDITVVIPAAGNVPDNILALASISCPAMIPVGGKPLIYWTLTYLRSIGLRKFKIAVSRRGMFVEDFVDCTFGKECEIEFVVPHANVGVVHTLKDLFHGVTTKSVCVVLGDTYFQFEDSAILTSKEPFVLYKEVPDSYRWCVANATPDGYVDDLIDKQPNLPSPISALIGVYFFPEVAVVRTVTDQLINQAAEKLELTSVLNAVRKQSPIRLIPSGEWLDCGNPDRQSLSHQALLQKREFNELNVDSRMGTITKQSHYVEKFIDEINYLRLLPNDLQVLFPRVLDYSVDWERPSVTMEYYGYPNLSEQFVFKNIEPSIWEQIFLHLKEIIQQGFMKHRHPLDASEVVDMYVTKTKSRLDLLTGPPELLDLVQHQEPVEINGEPFQSLQAMWPSIERIVQQLDVEKSGCLIHGDLCFSNILYDLKSRICKFVDPRGKFGSAGVFGDIRYDVAKLYHSVCGFYDFLVNDLFIVEGGNGNFKLDIRCRPEHLEIRKRFEKVFFQDFDSQEIMMITGLLFCSMTSLHYDHPRRQLAMYLRGLQLLNELNFG